MRKISFLLFAAFFCLGYFPAMAAGPNEQALLKAIGAGQAPAVSYIITRGADVDVKDKEGLTPLTTAVMNNRIDIIKILLDGQANVDRSDDNGASALWHACSQGHEEIALELLDKGANIDSKDKDGRTPLMMAAKGGFLNLTKILLIKGAHTSLLSADGGNALTMAAEAGFHDTARLLIDHGMSFPDVDENSEKFLLALVLGRFDEIRAMLEQGKNVEFKTRRADGRGILFWAAAIGNEEIVRLLLDREPGLAPKDGSGDKKAQLNKKEADEITAIAARNGKHQVVKEFLKRWRNPNAKDKNGNCALALAAEHGHDLVLDVLIESGADKNYKNPEGETALLVAAKNRRPQSLKTLIDHKADVDSRDRKGKTPLIWAVSKNDIYSTSQLLDQKAKIDSRDTDSWAAVHFAAANGSEHALQLLCGRGADVNLKLNQSQKSPLMLASENGHKEAVRILLEHGADVNATDFEGSNSLFVASEAGNDEIVGILLDKGADYSSESKVGVTPLMAAAFQGHLKVVQLYAGRKIPLDHKSKKLGVTALWTASINGRTEVMTYLLKNGADVNVTSKKGVTPLLGSVENGKFESVMILLEHWADRRTKDNNGLTAPEVARLSGQFHLSWLMNSFSQIRARMPFNSGLGYLGISSHDINSSLARSLGRESTEGAMVTNVINDSPAQASNIIEGDLILGFDGHPVKDARELTAMIESTKPGTRVTLVVFRKPDFMDIPVTMIERPPRDFPETILKYTPKSGLEYVFFPPYRKPGDKNHYIFHGKVHSGNSSMIFVELKINPRQEPKYWAFRRPQNAGSRFIVRSDIMVIGKIVDVTNSANLPGKISTCVVVDPDAIADADGKLAGHYSR